MSWPRGLVGGGMLALALNLASSRLDLYQPSLWIAPLIVFALGVALVWSPLDGAAADDARRPEVVVNLLSREHWFRVVAGFVFAGLGVWWMAALPFTENGALRTAGITAGIVVASGLLLAPWWIRLIRQVRLERLQRVREFERAEIAAHLHDSVLQTLTLIRANAHDADAVARLARSQERDLRSWLYEERKDGVASIAAALREALAEIEDAHSVAFDVVTVGDAPADSDLNAVVAATREAASNAARHGTGPVSVYAEVSDAAYETFVRDAGPGFDPALVSKDRMGIAQSIVGRIERHGGTAVVKSSPGRPTEVRIVMPREVSNG